MQVTIDRQIACVRRELAMRHRVYPRRIANEQMTAMKAAEEITAMEAVLTTLERLREEQMPSLFDTGAS